MNRLLIVDGNALIHRAYHALPDFKSKDGVPTNALYGFISVLHKVKEDLQPSHIPVSYTHLDVYKRQLQKLKDLVLRSLRLVPTHVQSLHQTYQLFEKLWVITLFHLTQ